MVDIEWELLGSGVLEKSKITNIKYISGINFRIAREVLGCSNKLLEHIINNKSIYNTLIVSPPGTRKNNNVKGFGKTNKQSELKRKNLME